MYDDLMMFLDKTLTRPAVRQTDKSGKEYFTSTFPFLRGKTLHSGLPYSTEENLYKDLEYNKKIGMFDDIGVSDGVR